MTPPLPSLPDGLWVVLKVLTQHGFPALSYAELESETELSKTRISAYVRTIVDHDWATMDKHGRIYRVTANAAGREAAIDRARLPTVKAVIAEARRITREEHAKAEIDPYYTKPYVPTDDVARKLSQQYGPERAIAMLAHRQAERRRRHALDEEVSEVAERRRERRARQTLRDRMAARHELSIGQRIDQALLDLQTAQSAPAARIDCEPVTDGGGGKDDANPVPNLHDDTLGRAERSAIVLVRKLEGEVDAHRRRLFAFERSAVAS